MRKSYQFVTRLIVLSLIIYLPTLLSAQNSIRDDNGKMYYQWYVNANGGISQSYCDIQSGKWQGAMLGTDEFGIAYGLRLGKHVSPVFTVFGSGLLGDLKGVSGVDTKNLNFNTDINYEFIGGMTVSFTNLIFGYKPRLVNLYGITGIGLGNFGSRAYRNDGLPLTRYGDGSDWSNDGSNGWENTSSTFIPTGFGLDFSLSKRWDVNLETTIRWADSDKLDGIETGTQLDAYYYTQVGLGFNFWRPKSGGFECLTKGETLALVGDSVPIEIIGTIPEGFNSKAVVDFTPVLKYGDKTTQLKTIYLQGTEVKEEFMKSDAIVIEETGGTFTYKTIVKYEPGMDNCELFVEPLASVKGRAPFSLKDRKVTDGLILTGQKFENDENILLADHGLLRNQTENAEAEIFYVVDRTNLDLKYKLNKDEVVKQNLENLNNFLAQGWKIKEIKVDAWASPEGEENHNVDLSEGRSGTGEEYIFKQLEELGLPTDVDVSVAAKGENWDGFTGLLRKSDIKDKDAILNIINSQSNLADREQEIRNMTIIYDEIEESILPPLRLSQISVICFKPEKSNDEILNLALNNPSELLEGELLYAGTLTNDINQQFNIYKAAADQFNNSWKANNNAGYAAIMVNELDDAANYLDNAKKLASNNGIVLNNLGAVSSKNKDYKQAMSNYLEAQKYNVDVNHNMGIVKIAQGNYHGAVNSFAGENCTYNKALSQTLSENYGAAKSTLDCTKSSAEASYLKAVIGARTDDVSMLVSNLKDAIAKDPNYKNIAKEDKEFLNFYSNSELMNILQ